jgi:hypothetical protein
MGDHLLDRIYGEYQSYKASVLGLTNAEIFSRCYEIDAMINLYDILAEKIESLDGMTIQGLLGCRNILAGLYERWLEKPGSSYADMEEHIAEEIERMAANEERSVNLWNKRRFGC